MTVIELMPILNLLLIPMFKMLYSINYRLTVLETTQHLHAARLEKLDGIKA